MSNAFTQFLLFAAVGATGTLAQYAVLWLGTDVLGMPAAWASGGGYLLGSVINYLLNHHFTFASPKSHRETIGKFYAIAGSGWLINTGLMSWLTATLLWNHWLSQLLTTAICLGWNFAGSKFWAFHHHSSDGAP